MQEAVRCLVGEHDFAAFCKSGSMGGTVRRVLSVAVTALEDARVEVLLEATSFCHQMVRSIVGLLEAIGHGRRDAGEMIRVLASRDRAANSNVAPPSGLTLWRVSYGVETSS
jgi:tRNA pseudouridine38-40 synthase